MTNEDMKELAQQVSDALVIVNAKTRSLQRWSDEMMRMTEPCPNCVTITINETVATDYLKDMQKDLEDAAKAVPVE